MKKILSLILSTILMIGLTTGLGVVSTEAAQKAKLKLSVDRSDLIVGEQVTLTVTPSVEGTVLYGSFQLNFDKNRLKFESTNNPGAVANATDPDGIIPVNLDAGMNESLSAITFTFSTIKKGTVEFSVSEAMIVIIDANDDSNVKQVEVSTNTASVEIWAKGSDDATLKKLKVDGFSLTPDFSPSITDYTVYVGANTDSVAISAIPSDSKAEVESIKGDPTGLVVGTNTITITVVAANGTKKIYKINIIRPEPATEPPSTEPPTEPPTTEPPTETSAIETTTDETESTTQEDTTYAVTDLSVKFDGKDYHLSSGFAMDELPEGFTPSLIKFNGQEVQGIYNASLGISLYYLTEGEGTAGAFYLYNETKNEICPYRHIEIGNTTYVIATLSWTEQTIPESIVKTVIVNDVSFDSYICTDDTDYIYFCAGCENGEYRLYCLDTTEYTVQRVHQIAAGSDSDITESLSHEISSLESENDSLKKDAKSAKTLLTMLLIFGGALIVVLLILVVFLAAREGIRKKQEKAILIAEEEEEDDIEIEEIGLDESEIEEELHDEKSE